MNRILISLLMILAIFPFGELLNKKYPRFFDPTQQSYTKAVTEQLNLAGNGYFSPWDGDSRLPLGTENLHFVRHLNELVRRREITIHDTIIHIATEQHPWIALPFPGFTGIRQSLLLVKRDPGDIHTAFGRLSDFPQGFDLQKPDQWVLIENSVQIPYNFKKMFELIYTKEYSNRRISLYRKTY